MLDSRTSLLIWRRRASTAPFFKLEECYVYILKNICKTFPRVIIPSIRFLLRLENMPDRFFTTMVDEKGFETSQTAVACFLRAETWLMDSIIILFRGSGFLYKFCKRNL